MPLLNFYMLSFCCAIKQKQKNYTICAHFMHSTNLNVICRQNFSSSSRVENWKWMGRLFSCLVYVSCKCLGDVTATLTHLNKKSVLSVQWSVVCAVPAGERDVSSRLSRYVTVLPYKYLQELHSVFRLLFVCSEIWL
jgi:hypothetical protein